MKTWKWLFYVKPEPAPEHRAYVKLTEYGQWIAQFPASTEDAKACALKLSEGGRTCYLMRDAEAAKTRFTARDGREA